MTLQTIVSITNTLGNSLASFSRILQNYSRTEFASTFITLSVVEFRDLILWISPQEYLHLILFLASLQVNGLGDPHVHESFPFLGFAMLTFTKSLWHRIFLSEFMVETATQVSSWLLADAEPLLWTSVSVGKLPAFKLG
jgi:hypothetical protein